jgi:POT family proton-dependent oligopeptide transporter
VGLYPLLRKWKIDFTPVRRIFTGFLLASVSMVYASVLQHYIYISPPNSIHVWIQAPAYIFVAFSEAFIIVTGLEIAFTQAPKKSVPHPYQSNFVSANNNSFSSLRSFISAMFWLTIGIAAAICIGLSPVSQDPYLVWMYGSLGIVGFVAGCTFFVCFRKSGSLNADIPCLVEGVSVEGNVERVMRVATRSKDSHP